MFVALGIQIPMRMRHMVICSLSGSIVFLYNGPIIEKKKKVIEHEMCVLMFATAFAETFLVLIIISEILS